MYQHYFGLTETPFSIAPDPRYLFLSEKHREALAHLIYGVGDQGGFIVLTGEVGTGKTTICRCLLQQVPENAEIAFIINPKQSINQLLQSIFGDLGLEYSKGDTSKDLIDKLNTHLLDAHSKGINTILIIDEAQNLSVDVLEQLRLLTNLETNEKKLLQLVLLGQPELNHLLTKPELRQLAQRVTARYHLTPLSKPEVAEYVAHRLSVAGSVNSIFPPSSVKEVARLSKGVPRLINLICDRAMLGVYANNLQQASPKIIRKASKEIFTDTHGEKNQVPVRGIAVLTVLLVLMFGLYSYFKAPSNRIERSETQQEVANTENVLLTNESFDQLRNILYQQQGLPSAFSCDRDREPNVKAYCYSGAISYSELMTLETPVVLELSRESDKAGSILVTGVTENEVSYTDGEDNFIIDILELQQYTITDTFYLSYIPSNIRFPIHPGDSGDSVVWVRNYFGLENTALNDLSYESRTSDFPTQSKMDIFYAHHIVFSKSQAHSVYDEAMQAEVRQLQNKLGYEGSASINRDFIKTVQASRVNTNAKL